jgi:hypothetical protein
MTMRVSVTTVPTTLDEAKLSKRIHEAVAKIVDDAGGLSNKAHRSRVLNEYPQVDGSVLHTVGYIEDAATHYVNVEGAAIPHPKICD